MAELYTAQPLPYKDMVDSLGLQPGGQKSYKECRQPVVLASHRG